MKMLLKSCCMQLSHDQHLAGWQMAHIERRWCGIFVAWGEAKRNPRIKINTNFGAARKFVEQCDSLHIAATGKLLINKTTHMKPTCFRKAQSLLRIIFKHVWFHLTF